MIIQNIGMAYVKCTRLLEPPEVRLEKTGIVGDREFLLLDGSGEVLPSHHHGLFLPLTFAFDSAKDLLTLTYPDGHSVSGSGSPMGAIIDLDYLGMRHIAVRSVLGDWDRLLSDFAGKTVQLVRAVNPGDGIDVLPITVITTGSLSLLAEKLGAPVDYRRFRANLIIENNTPFAEDAWDGRQLRVGDAIIGVRSSVPRCIVTQLDPQRGDNNLAVVPALARFRDKVKLPDGLMPKFATPGFASYATVVRAGHVAVGDEVELI